MSSQLASAIGGNGEFPDIRFYQGHVLEWNPINGENRILVNGGTLSNVPVLNSVDVINFRKNTVVGLLWTNGQMFVTGRIVPAASAEYGTSTNALRPQVATEGSSGVFLAGHTSSNWEDLPGVGETPVIPEVFIGPSESAIITVSANFDIYTGANFTVSTSYAQMSYKATNLETGTTFGEDAYWALRVGIGYDDTGVANSRISRILTGASRTIPVTGITPGYYTVVGKYMALVSGASGSQAWVSGPTLTVQPI